MKSRTRPGAPLKLHILIDKFCTIQRNRIISCLWRNQKAPDIALMFSCTIRFDFIYSPVVFLAPFDTFWWSITYSTLTAAIYTGNVGFIGVYYRIFIDSKINIMLACVVTRRPADRCHVIDIRC